MQRVVSILCRTHQVYSTRVYRTMSKLLSARQSMYWAFIVYLVMVGVYLVEQSFYDTVTTVTGYHT